jgi:hypothetical protein
MNYRRFKELAAEIVLAGQVLDEINLQFSN